MKIYVAAPKQLFLQAKALAFDLTKAQHTVVSSWLFTTDAPLDEKLSVAEATEKAADCLSEIIASDLIVILLPDTQQIGRLTGGFWVEFGYALAKKSTCVTVGPAWNIFEFLPQVTRLDSLEELSVFLEEGGYDE